MSLNDPSDWNYSVIKGTAKKNKMSINNLIVLSQQNDPFYIGTRSQVRSAKWISEIVYDYRRNRKKGKTHDRAIHYYILSKNLKRPFNVDGWKIFKGDTNDFHWVMKSIQNARYLGYISFDWIEDKKNPEAIIFADYRKHTPNTSEIPINAETFSEITASRCHLLNPQLQQAYHVEIWTEKTTINDILVPLGREYGVNIIPFSGQSTTTRIHELMERTKGLNKPVRILYISDYDKYGQNMPVSCGRKIHWFLQKQNLGMDIKLDKILLTKEQVQKYKLPSAPDVKFKVEIDALEVYYPNETAKIVENAVLEYIDPKVNEEIAERNSEVQMVIYNAILEQKHVIDYILSDVDLSEAQEILNKKLPQADKTTESNDMIFDSGRPYLEQVKIFKGYLEKD